MSRTWWENEHILAQFREWLVDTGREVAAADRLADSDSADSDSADSDSADSDSADSELGYRELGYSEPGGFEPAVSEAGEPEQVDSEESSHGDETDPRDWPAEALPEVGLLQLLEALTALRHELKLQTKSARGLDENVRAALRGLDDASRQFQSVQAREREAAERAVRPYVETLIAWHEAVGRGIQAFAAAHQQVTEAGTRRLRDDFDQQFRQLPWWRRWLNKAWYTEVSRVCTETFRRLSSDDFRGVTLGFHLVQSRLDRSLQEHQIQRLECAGRRVDPTEMTVVELVDDPQAVPETVVEEVRPGYSWRGQVVRFAEVRAVRGMLAATAETQVDQIRN